MLSRTKRELRAVEDAMTETANQAKSIIESASKEGRSRTDEENADIAEFHKKLEVLKGNKRELEDQLEVEESIQESVKGISEDSEPVQMKHYPQPKAPVTYGEAFVQSEGFKRLQAEVKNGGRLSSGAIETKGTLGITAGSGGTALAGPVPEVIPGVVDKLFQQVRVPDLILQGQTSSSSLRYVVEGTATSGAAGVAEAGAKPQSTLGFTTSDEPVRKIATSIKVTDEMLEDASAVRSYIDGRLALFVNIEEERQVVLGAGTNDLVGIKPSGNTRGINIYAGGTAAGNKAVQLFKALNGQRGSALLEPDWIVLNPSDYQDLRLLTDTAGQFFGGGPFQGQYGNGGLESVLSGQVSGATDHIWGLPVVVTTATGAGTALIGTRSAAQLFRRGGLTVEATNSHDTDFLYNLVTIRAEKRCALAVYRPVAFTEVRLA
jgi:HK97 family phage major capsid protein